MKKLCIKGENTGRISCNTGDGWGKNASNRSNDHQEALQHIGRTDSGSQRNAWKFAKRTQLRNPNFFSMVW